MKPFSLSLPLTLITFFIVPSAAYSDIIFDTWTTNEGGSGNYALTVSDQGEGVFDFNLTINPWNAEGLGVFFDLGGVDVGD